MHDEMLGAVSQSCTPSAREKARVRKKALPFQEGMNQQLLLKQIHTLVTNTKDTGEAAG